MTETTVPARDSSRQDRKAPGNFLRRTSQPRFANVVVKQGGRHSAPRRLQEAVKTASADRHAAVADRLIKLLGDTFDALGGGIERTNHRVGCGLGPISGNEASVL